MRTFPAAPLALAAALALPAAAQQPADDGLLPPAAGEARAMTAEEVKEIALQAILENPEVVMEAVAILQERQARAEADAARAALSDNRDALERDDNAPVLGNPEGDVTVVEFFDYNCPYCRRAGAEVAALIAADPNVRVVYREWPILGEESVVAARAALASREQGLYPAFHEALMGQQIRLDEALVMEVAAEVGLDVERLRADMDAPEVQAHIDASMELARSLGINGTPAFVVADALAPGVVTAEELARMVAAAREDG